MTWIVEIAPVLTIIGQTALLAVFLTISASIERRRTGLILASFAAFYLGLVSVNGVLNNLSPPLYALLYAIMDFAAARLVWMYGSKGKEVQIIVLCAFVLTHIMAWSYASGLYSPLDPQRYVVLTFCLVAIQIIVSIPGIKDGIYEIRDMVQKALESYRVRTQHYRDSHSQHISLQDRLQSICRRSPANPLDSGTPVRHSAPVDSGQAGGDIQ